MKTILLQVGDFNVQSLLPWLGIIAVFYFFILRPQNKQRKETQSLLDNLSNGDEVITTGGIHGKVVKDNGTTFVVLIDKNTKITIEKSAISLEMTKALKEKKDSDK